MPSSTATITAAVASPTCAGNGKYELPVKDAACGVPNIKNYQSLFDTCAKPAGPRPYYNDCALWSPAVDQSVQDLTDCLYKAGVAWEDVWCSGAVNATATANSYPSATATDAPSSKDDGGTTGSPTSVANDPTSNRSAAFSSRDRIPTKIALGLLGLVITGAMGCVI